MGIRIVKTMADVQKALNELFDWKQSQQSQNINMSGRRIINAGNGVAPTDYATVGQLPVVTSPVIQTPTLYYTIVFNPPDACPAGTISPPFQIGTGRGGNPTQAWVQATGAPAGTAVTVNFMFNGVNLLPMDITLAVGATQAYTQTFNSPTQLLAVASQVQMIVTSANTATGLSGGVVVLVTQQASSPTQANKN